MARIWKTIDRTLPGGLILLAMGVSLLALTRGAADLPAPAQAVAPTVPTLPNPAAQRDAQVALLADILLRLESIDARLAEIAAREPRP